jgi:hypothetical protein
MQVVGVVWEESREVLVPEASPNPRVGRVDECVMAQARHAGQAALQRMLAGYKW